MAPRLSGFTRASSLGPAASFIERHGGSIARILRDVGLPYALVEKPELIVPLREQFRFLERAARETGDACFGARLGQVVRMKDLSAFGAWVHESETLLQAIERGHAGINAMLQTSTVLTLERRGPLMRWSVEFVEPESEGRHHNEMLAVCYMIDTVRGYAGPRWRPDVIRTALPTGTPRAELERVFAANVSLGHAATSIEFAASLLAAGLYGYPAGLRRRAHDEPVLPGQHDMLATVSAVTDLALYEGYPRIGWVAAKLGMSRRTLQRELGGQGTTFGKLVEGALSRRAKSLLADSTMPVTGIALELGYKDAAHFTRAFRRWTGVPPTAFRNACAL